MPTTRSQAADEKTTTLRVYEDSPASPSETAQVSTMEPPPTEPMTEMNPPPTERRPHGNTGMRMQRARAPSIRSTSSATARIRQAELEAEMQLAAIKKQELELQASMIRKRLAADVAAINEETDRESLCADEADAERRVKDWLQDTPVRGERGNEDRPRDKSHERIPPVTPSRVAFAGERRSVSPAPARVRERGQGIERLADTLEKIARIRAPTRQTQDLPSFSGAVGEWLPFKAAMRESSGLYGFTPTENLARLRSCLKGEARQTVSALLYTASDPAVIMKTLEQCYGRPEIIIDNALEEIKRLPRLGPSAGDLNSFAIKLQNIVTVISCLDERGYLQNPMLARNITEKLTPHIKSKWCDYAEEYGSRSEPEIMTLSRFLMREADRAVKHSYSNNMMSLQMPRYNAPKEIQPRQNERRRGAPIYATTTNAKDEKNVCLCCGADHATLRCRKLTSMTVPERWEWAKETRVCFQCMNDKHRRFKCRARKCGINECRLPHHALLHHIKDEKKEETAITASTHLASEERQVLLKVCPITVKGENGRQIDTYALLDEGSTITLIDEEIALAIGADGPTRDLNIHSVTTTQKETLSRAVTIEIKGKAQTEYHSIHARTVRNLMLGKHAVKEDLLHYKHLKKLRPDEVCYDDAKPRVLIGADQWHLIVTRKLLTGKKNQPAASLTRLGWIIHGSTPCKIITQENNGSILHVRVEEKQRVHDHDLEQMVKAHFEIDSLGITKKRKPIETEERAKEIFNKTAKRVNGRFEVGLPWRNDEVNLPPSYDMAMQRLRNIERKMDKSPSFEAEYTKQVTQLLAKDYAKECKVDHEHDSRVWYLPHFAVTNPNKPGKVRMVFDAAATANGVSLNDALLDGPDMLQPLHGVLFRFRNKPVAVTADIREMFLRIKIRTEDQAAQHFLWRGKERTKPPTKYIMKSMIFGARSSPFLAHSVRNKNAEEHQKSHPLAYQAITRNHYMDDWVESFNTEEEATAAVNEVIYVHQQAGFELAGWGTNAPRILKGQVNPDAITIAPKEIGAKINPYEKTLGIIWMPEEDKLSFNTHMPRVPEEVKQRIRAPTKREALSAIMSIFDPLGLLSPYTITAKIMLQGLWRKKTGWDEPLPIEENGAFEDWLDDIKYVRDLQLPRCYEKDEIRERQLHIFCDASEQAYAAVAYWRNKKNDGSISVALIAGKAKVAPMKTQSIPRLELQASLIGARLAADILKEHEVKETKLYLWSDSKTALHWIRNDSARYTPYVAHRLSEIDELTEIKQWHWIPTAQNVADDATRAGNTQIKGTDRWFTGPSFLYENENKWPQEEKEESIVLEVITEVNEEKRLIDMTRFSSYEKLSRTMAYVIIFINKCQKKNDCLSLENIEKAERILITEAQKESFPNEIQRLKKGRNIERTSRLSQLDPKIENGILRLNGRINATSVPEEIKEPPILDGKHHLTQLLIINEHVKNKHAGRDHVVNNLRQKYWILKLRPAVKKALKQCVLCHKKKAMPNVPIKGNLPKARLEAYSRPFSNCGVDCFGPMWVTIGRRKEKRWGMLFTCLTTRAVHIELIPSLSTDSAIMGLRRMSARRGWPKIIISDNGTNFHGAATELKKAIEEWRPELENWAITQRIDWRFIDPGAPNQGGAWERLIRSVKVALSTTLNEKAPKEEVLATAMAEVEHTINARPLTHVPVEPDEQEAITPNHFLLGSALGVPHIGTCESANRNTWKAAQHLANTFWARWLKEYLPTLTPRGDTQRNIADIKEGDIVIIVDGILPRNVWPYGRIEKLCIGPDNVARSAEVRTKGGIFRRPVRRLIVLPIQRGCENLRRGETVTDDESTSNK